MQKRAEQQPEYQLREKTIVFFEIAPKKLHPVMRGDSLLSLLYVELFRRFEEQGNTFLLTFSFSAYPMLTKFLFRIGYKSFAWVCYKDGVFPFFVLLYFTIVR